MVVLRPARVVSITAATMFGGVNIFSRLLLTGYCPVMSILVEVCGFAKFFFERPQGKRFCACLLVGALLKKGMFVELIKG